jgi:polysaccharide export outer membrane protein
MNTNSHMPPSHSRIAPAAALDARLGAASRPPRRWALTFLLAALSLGLLLSGSGCQTVSSWFSSGDAASSLPVAVPAEVPATVAEPPPVTTPSPPPASTTNSAAEPTSAATPNLLSKWWSSITKLFSGSEPKASPAVFDEADMAALADVLTNAQAASLVVETQTNAPADNPPPPPTKASVISVAPPATNAPAPAVVVAPPPTNAPVVIAAPPPAIAPVAVPAPPATNAPAVALLPGDRLNEGDVIQIAFPGASNLNAVVKIPADGIIRLPFSTNIQAAGLTLEQLREAVLNNYESQLQLREVTITVVTSSSAVYVSGAVLRPGRIPVVRPMTALEAVMEAGGFDPNRAKPSRVTVIRYQGGKQITHKVDLQRVLDGKPGEPFYLKPFDILYVPAKTFNF